MAWTLIEREAASAVSNMEYDAELLRTLEPSAAPILHLYEWERPSLTYGFFAHPEKVLNLEVVERQGFDRARRPTGGGVVFHAWDLAFSVLIPAHSSLYSHNTLDNYALINAVVSSVVHMFLGESFANKNEMSLTPEDGGMQNPGQAFFCMARPTKYDLVVGKKKIAGAAQRKTKQGFLHQGTLALQFPDWDLLSEMLPSQEVCEAIQQTTFPLLGENESLEQGRKKLTELLKNHFLTL